MKNPVGPSCNRLLMHFSVSGEKPLPCAICRHLKLNQRQRTGWPTTIFNKIKSVCTVRVKKVSFRLREFVPGNHATKDPPFWHSLYKIEHLQHRPIKSVKRVRELLTKHLSEIEEREGEREGWNIPKRFDLWTICHSILFSFSSPPQPAPFLRDRLNRGNLREKHGRPESINEISRDGKQGGY